MVSRELAAVVEEFGTPRRTVLLEGTGADARGATRATAGAGLVSSTSDVPLTIPDDPCRVLLSATGLVARTAGSEPVPRSGARRHHDAITGQVAATARGRIGVVTDAGRLVRLDVVATPEVPRSDGALSLAGGQPAHLLVDLGSDEKVVGLVPIGSASNPPIVLATATGVVKRVRPGDEPGRGEAWGVISLADGDRVVFASTAADSDVLALVSSDARLLRFEASRVRPQGRGAGGVAGICLHEGACVIAGAAVPADLLAEAVVVTIADAEGALPSAGTGSVKVTPLDRYPAKGRATNGVRAQRFLRGEDELVLAWVGVGPARAVDGDGRPVDLPAVNERRDASGSPLPAPVVGIG